MLICERPGRIKRGCTSGLGRLGKEAMAGFVFEASQDGLGNGTLCGMMPHSHIWPETDAESFCWFAVGERQPRWRLVP
jgi:hypothetical protein